MEWTMRGKRWAKKFNRREARRENKCIVADALIAYAVDLEEQHELYLEYVADEEYREFLLELYEEEMYREELENKYEQAHYYDYYPDEPFEWRFEDAYARRD